MTKQTRIKLTLTLTLTLIQLHSCTFYRLGDVEDVFDLTWSPDGRFLLAGTSENSAHIYDTLTGTCIARVSNNNVFNFCPFLHAHACR